MKIIVCVKQVPDAEARLTVQDGKPSWGDAPLVLNPFDEYALEGALQQKDALGGEVIVICIGPDGARDALKRALSMGADQAVLISAENLDSQGAARLLAAAIRKLGGADLVLFGRQGLDTATGVTGAQTARVLGVPFLGLAGAIKVESGQVTVERVIEEGRQTVRASLPAVLSVMQSIGEPRYPSFLGIRKANKAEIPAWTPGDLGLDAPAPRVQRVGVAAPPTRQAECEFITGETPQAIAEQLVEKILAEKVL